MRILFIEDSADDQALISRLLFKGMRRLHMDVCQSLGAAALRLDESAESPYDMILTDLHLPDGNGSEVLGMMREKGVIAPVVVLTGSGDHDAVIAALKMGVTDYIRKDESYIQQLPVVLLRAIDRHSGIGRRRLEHIRVLYLEHNPGDIELTLRHMGRHAQHITMETAETGEAAIELLGQRDREHYDVLMLNYRLPGRTGLDMLKQIHVGMGLQVPIIILIGVDDEQAALEALRLGAAGVVIKDEGYPRRLPVEIESARLRFLSLHDLDEMHLKEQALEAAGNGILITDHRLPDDPVVYVNAAFERMSGYSREEIVGRNCRFLQGPDTNQPGLARLRASINKGEAARIELVNYRKNGAAYWVNLYVTPVNDAAGDITHYVGVVEDISERKRHENALWLAAKVFESFNEAVFITDESRKVVQVNRAFTVLTGHSRESVVSRRTPLLEDLAADDQERGRFWAQIKSKGYWHGESTARRRDGTPYPVWLSISSARDAEGNVLNYIVCFYDITDFKESQKRLQDLASYDSLTGLLNRTLFDDRLLNTIDRARRHDQHLAVLFIDLDDFKLVNDTLGHQAGDGLLKVTADRLRTAVRSGDSVCRVGGDEFMVLLTALEAPEQAARTATRILESMAPPVEVEGHQIVLSASIGIALYPDDGTDGATLIRKADTAMFKAKEQGRNLYKYFTEEMNAEVYDRLIIEQSLRRAVERDQLFLEFQPRVRLSDNALVGMEALLRWQHPRKGLISPDRFIPVAEATGLILPIGEWVLRTVAGCVKRWSDAGLRQVTISFNLSPMQLRQHDLNEHIHLILTESGVPSGTLEAEITEGAVMEEPKQAVSTLQRLKDTGISIAIDDFGVGYSSLSYLKRFPADRLKIDRSFVRGISEDDRGAGLVLAVIMIAHSMGFKVVAQGVETLEQLEQLVDMGCEEAQGYLFSGPVPEQDVPTLLRSGIVHPHQLTTM